MLILVALMTKNSHCLGDAVHRHPPMNGLGSNTCIQDAANLAWKIALVEKGQCFSLLCDEPTTLIDHRGMTGVATPSLLNTYSTERQAVGAGVVQR